MNTSKHKIKNNDSIKIIKADIFSSSKNIIQSKNLGATVVVPHVCNNIGVFGGGFAACVRNNYPIVSTNFELLGKKTKLGYVQYITAAEDDLYKHKLIFANMIAQNNIIGPNNRRPINYEALVKCMVDVRQFINSLDKDKIQIHCPKFGSGLAGGNWNFISDLIRDIWPSIDVIIYQLS